jgi:hypothetical protein
MTGRPLLFWQVGGDVIWRGVGRAEPISTAQAEALREDFAAFSRSAFRAGDRDAALRWTQGWLDLTRALDAQAQWFRVIGVAYAKGLS